MDIGAPDKPKSIFVAGLKQYLSKISGSRGSRPVKVQSRKLLAASAVSLAGSVIGIAVIGFITSHFSMPLLLAPFGASAVLLFSVYDSPLAQPRNTVVGHAASALIGGLFALVHLTFFNTGILDAEGYIWIAMAVAVSIFVMQAARITHPPAGATAFIASTAVTSPDSLLAFMVPVAAGALILVAIAIAFNNAVPSRRYPAYW
jgi:CBS-domain-containing membrane protein